MLECGDANSYISILRRLPPQSLQPIFSITRIDEREQVYRLTQLLSQYETIGIYTLLYATNAYQNILDLNNLSYESAKTSLETFITDNRLKYPLTIYHYSHLFLEGSDFIYYEEALELIKNPSSSITQETSYDNYLYLNNLIKSNNIPEKLNQKIIDHFAIKYYDQHFAFPPEQITRITGTSVRAYLAERKLLSITDHLISEQTMSTFFNDFRSMCATWLFLRFSLPEDQARQAVSSLLQQPFHLQNMLAFLNNRTQPDDVKYVGNSIRQHFDGLAVNIDYRIQTTNSNTTLINHIDASICNIEQEGAEKAFYDAIKSGPILVNSSTIFTTGIELQPFNAAHSNTDAKL